MKKLLVAGLLAGLGCATALAGINIGGTNYAADTLQRRQIGPGVFHTVIRIPDFPLNVYLLETDLNNPYNRVETTQAQGQVGKTEGLVSQARRWTTPQKRVLGGCNANFWCVPNQGSASVYGLGSAFGAVVRNDTTYLNTNCVNDTWNGGPMRTGAAAIDHDKRLHLGRFTWAASVSSSRLAAPVAINKVNRRNLPGEMCLWNAAYGRDREFEDNWTSDGTQGNNGSDNYFLTFATGNGWQTGRPMTLVVSSIVTDRDRLTLGTYDACITAAGSCKAAMRTLAVGDTVTVNAGWTTSEPGEPAVTPWIANMVEGNAPVMHLGQLTGRNTDEVYNSQVYSRTAYGCDATGKHLYMIVIDKSTSPRYGRSAGCSTTVMCQILQDLYPDISEVVNFDAGGSAQMLIDGAIANTTTEGTPRAVANGWFVESVAPADTAIASIAFASHRVQLPVYATATPQVLGYNQYGDLVSENVQGVTLACTDTLGTCAGSAVTALGAVGTGTLTATYRGLTATTRFVTLAAQPAIATRPVMVVDSRAWPVPVTATVDGATYDYDPAHLQFTVEDPAVATVEGGLIRGLANGSTRLICQIGEFADTVPLRVEISDTPAIDQAWNGWALKGSGAKSLAITADGLLTYTYSSSRAPYVQLKKNITFFGLPDSITLTFTSSLPLNMVQFKVGNGQHSEAYQTLHGPSDGLFAAGVQHTVHIDMDELGGTDRLTTYPITLSEVRLTPDKATATTGAQTLQLRLTAHYPVATALPGDLDGDGQVNTSDVTLLVTAILGGDSSARYDLDGNGQVNTADVTALVTLLLSK